MVQISKKSVKNKLGLRTVMMTKVKIPPAVSMNTKYNLTYLRENCMDKEVYGYTNWLVYILTRNTYLSQHINKTK